MAWINTNERLPEPETEVLIKADGRFQIAALEWEIPNFEETFQPFLYWRNAESEQSWDQAEVLKWCPIPEEL